MDETTDRDNVYPLYGSEHVETVTEPGLYRLMFQGTTPAAREFQRWVWHEVLPSIRKTGIYAGELLSHLPAPIASAFEQLDERHTKE